MVWNHNKKIIFIHIPKTGGSTIEKVMNLDKQDIGCGFGKFYGKALQHLTFDEIKKILGDEMFNKYDKISVYRNPYSRIVSEYYWCQVNGIGNSSGQDFDSFLDYVERCVKNSNFNETIYHDHFMPQHQFVFNAKNKLIVDMNFL